MWRLRKLVILSLLALPAFGAIVYDNAGFLGSSVSTTYTVSYTVGAGSDRILFVGISNSGSGSDGVTAITYNGVALTKIASAIHSGSGSAALWYLVNPASGANNVVVSAPFTGLEVFAASYSGANQSGQPDAYASDATSTAAGGDGGIYTISPAVTTVADNDWLITAAYVIGTWIVGGNSTVRGVSAGSDGELVDRGPITPAGSSTLTMATLYSGGGPIASVTAAFKPVGAASSPVRRRMIGGED